MTIFNNSCIFYYIFLMPCCGILLRHFALYINLSQHRWADFFALGWRQSQTCSGLGSSQDCHQSVQADTESSPGHPAVLQLLPRAAAHISHLMFFPLFQHPQPSFGAGGGETFDCRASLPSSRTFCLETWSYLGYCWSVFSSGELSLPFWDH